jgi:hypothetical protein
VTLISRQSYNGQPVSTISKHEFEGSKQTIYVCVLV